MTGKPSGPRQPATTADGAQSRRTAPRTFRPASSRIGAGQIDKRRRDPMPAMSFLQGSDLWSTWQRLSALEKDLRQIQPRLALTPLKLANQVLVVTAGSPAIAARLRQFEPSLIEGLRARGWLVGRIRFRPIAIHDEPPPPKPREKEPVSPKVISELQSLEEDDMNPELRAALRAFVRRQQSDLGS
jgi:hypothetical protein